MNGEELIDEVLDVLLTSDYSREQILRRLNQALRFIAGSVLLPGLADGYSTVQTVIGRNSVPLPDNYARELYLAKVAGKQVAVYGHAGMMVNDNYPWDVTTGSIDAVAPHGGRILYQRVPATITPIELFYYRIPEDLEDGGGSYPDGLGGNVGLTDASDEALTSHVLWKLFDRIEQGTEGKKVDALRYEGFFQQSLKKIESAMASQGRPRQPPPICRGEF